MLKRDNPEASVRCFIVVDEQWPVIENTCLVIAELEIRRYAEIIPELFDTSPTRSCHHVNTNSTKLSDIVERELDRIL